MASSQQKRSGAPPERKERLTGKHGAPIHTVLIGSVLAPVGTSVQELVRDEVPIETESELNYIKPIEAEVGGAVPCSDLDKATQKHYVGLQKPHSATAFAGRLAYAG